MNKLYSLVRKSVIRHYADIRKAGTELVFNKEAYMTNLNKAKAMEEKNAEYFFPFFKKSLFYDDRIAIKDSSGIYSYATMFVTARKIGCQISNVCGSASSSHVGYICTNNVLCPLMQWACWLSGQIAIPFDTTFPTALINHIAGTTKIKMMMASIEFEKVAREVAEKHDIVLLLLEPTVMATPDEVNESLRKLFINIGDMTFIDGAINNDFYIDKTALIQYVINYDKTPLPLRYTHRDLHEQIKFYVKTYDYCSDDTLLSVVPHTNWHINLDGMSVFSEGGKVIFHDESNLLTLWEELIGINGSDKLNANILLADSSTYTLLINTFAKVFMHDTIIRDYISSYCSTKYRLMIADFSKLSKEIHKNWKTITNSKLYERFIEIENLHLVDLDTKASQGLDEAFTVAQALGRTCKSSESMENLYKKLLKYMLHLEYEEESESGEKSSDSKRSNFMIIYKEMLVVFGGETSLLEPFKENIFAMVMNAVVIRLIPHIENIAFFKMPSVEGQQKHVTVLCIPKSKQRFNYDSFEDWLSKVLPSYKKHFVIKIVEKIPDDLSLSNEFNLEDDLKE
ncbi:malonate--CoA ligase ACSF3, mitochondrial isoform X2 [Teleopsis dalmanni]|nr:malonate--CoA ligase ACSF3, mitochondrial isoform X2 [Teleopsis dalmanni]XP_037958561.1 malonate--CoA ligase ACSF3, mitochondrial isoform X2 [Teleopsis dalmanni]